MEIKNCPFCGRYPVFKKMPYHTLRISCWFCKFHFTEKSKNLSENFQKQELINKWNTRVEPHE